MKRVLFTKSFIAILLTIIIGCKGKPKEAVDTVFYQSPEEYQMEMSRRSDNEKRTQDSILRVKMYEWRGEIGNSDYVDLGLPSGTKWKRFNEGNYYLNDVKKNSSLRGKVPSRKQWEELNRHCEWTWEGEGYCITGPNGNSISLPAVGYTTLVYDHGTYYPPSGFASNGAGHTVGAGYKKREEGRGEAAKYRAAEYFQSTDGSDDYGLLFVYDHYSGKKDFEKDNRGIKYAVRLVDRTDY